jgi:predicted HAD superfamily phosphohydrolase
VYPNEALEILSAHDEVRYYNNFQQVHYNEGTTEQSVCTFIYTQGTTYTDLQRVFKKKYRLTEQQIVVLSTLFTSTSRPGKKREAREEQQEH